MPEVGWLVRAAATCQVFVDEINAPILSGEDLHHLIHVLRVKPGESVIASDGVGRWIECRLAGGNIDCSNALEIDGDIRVEHKRYPVLTVGFTLVKGDRPDLVVQKLTELGIDRIVPLRTQRSVVRWDADRAARGIDKLRRISRAAAAQSRQVWLPEVTDVSGLGGLRTLSDITWHKDVNGSIESCSAKFSNEPVLAQIGSPPLSPLTTTVAVGPEGGWGPLDLALGYQTCGLGSSVLRSETGAIAAGVLMSAFRDEYLSNAIEC